MLSISTLLIFLVTTVLTFTIYTIHTFVLNTYLIRSLYPPVKDTKTNEEQKKKKRKRRGAVGTKQHIRHKLEQSYFSPRCENDIVQRVQRDSNARKCSRSIEI